MSRVQRVPIASAGGRFFVPTTGGAAASIGIRPPAILNSVELQVLGQSNDNFSLSIPAIAAGDTVDVPYTYNPKSFPVNFILVGGASGVVYADLIFPVLPVGCGILGVSKSLMFGLGPPQQPGSPIWSLAANQTYQAASVQGSIRFFSPAGCDAQTLTVAAWIFMCCSPPTVS